MQEIMKDGSEGKTFVEDTIEELLPHIKKSLEDPNVKYVKVFRGKTLVAGLLKPGIREQEKFVAEEEKKDMIEKMDEILEIDEKGDVVKKEK